MLQLLYSSSVASNEVATMPYFNSCGKLIHGPFPKIVALVDHEIVDYYRSLIPKYCARNKQKHYPHITVVRGSGVEVVDESFRAEWDKHIGRSVEFHYSGEIQVSGKYYYLRVYSADIEALRESIGLKKYRRGFDCYHITIGNCK